MSRIRIAFWVGSFRSRRVIGRHLGDRITICPTSRGYLSGHERERGTALKLRTHKKRGVRTRTAATPSRRPIYPHNKLSGVACARGGGKVQALARQRRLAPWLPTGGRMRRHGTSGRQRLWRVDRPPVQGPHAAAWYVRSTTTLEGRSTASTGAACGGMVRQRAHRCQCF